MTRSIALALGALLAGGALTACGHAAQQTADASQHPAVSLATVRQGIFTTRVVTQGRVGPPAGSTTKVPFPEAGIVAAIDVRVGQTIVAGTPIAELNRRSLEVGVDQAQADAAAAAGQYAGGAVPSAAVRSAQAKLALADARIQTLERGGAAAQSDEIAAQQVLRQAALKVDADQATLARDQTLLAGGVIAQKDLQAAQNQLAADEADVRAARAKAAAAQLAYSSSLRQARADRAQAQTDLRTAQAQINVLSAQSSGAAARLAAARLAYAQGVLRAPVDGVVTAIDKHPGESVDTTTPVVEIGPGAADAITLTVPAETARRIATGDAVRLTDAQSGAAASGRVSAVVPAIDPATQSATVTVSGAPLDAVPGDAIEATIVVAHRAGIIVPSSALVEDPQTGKTVVFVRKGDGSFDAREVEVPASDQRIALVARGLRVGERIAAQGSYELLAPPGG